MPEQFAWHPASTQNDALGLAPRSPNLTDMVNLDPDTPTRAKTVTPRGSAQPPGAQFACSTLDEGMSPLGISPRRHPIR